MDFVKNLMEETMLVLQRRIHESIMIGDHVCITVLGMNSKNVQIGIHAPRVIPIHRLEIYEWIKKESTVFTLNKRKMSHEISL